MNKFVLSIQPNVFTSAQREPTEKFQKIMSLKRHFKNVSVDVLNGVEIDDSANVQLMSVIGLHVTNLIRCDIQISFMPSEVIMKLLEQLPDLEELALNIRHITEYPSVSIEPVTLKKLKKLRVSQAWNVLQFLNAPSLVDLEAHGSVNKLTTKSLELFLKASTKIESLLVDLSIFDEIDYDLSFKLKNLVCLNFVVKYGENVEKFLLSQAATIEKFEAACESSELHEIVFTKFRRLKIIKLSFYCLSVSICRQLKPLLLVTEVECSEGFISEAAMQAVLGNCPELVKLKYQQNRDIPNYLNFIAQHNRKLEVLWIPTISAESTRFECLKELILEIIEEDGRLIAFLERNLTIETLHIRNLRENDIGIRCFDILIHGTGLKHVQIIGSDLAVDDVYERIKQGFGTWKTLQLSNQRECYDFNFSVKPADWMPKDRLADNEHRLIDDNRKEFCMYTYPR